MKTPPTSSVRLGALLEETRSGKSFRGKPPEDPDGTVRVIRLGNVDYEHASIDWKGCPTINRDDISGRHLLNPENVLITGRGQHRTAFWLEDLPGLAVADAPFFVLDIDTDQAHPGFIAWQINQPREQDWLRRHARGTVHPTLRKNDLRRLPVQLPDLSTQHRLSDLHRQIRRQRDLLTNLQSCYEDLARGILKRYI